MDPRNGNPATVTPGVNPPVTHQDSTTAPQDPPEPISSQPNGHADTSSQQDEDDATTDPYLEALAERLAQTTPEERSRFWARVRLKKAGRAMSKTLCRDVDPVVHQYYPALVPTVRVALAVVGSMALKGRELPLSVILETTSGYGKTTVLQMLFPLENSGLDSYVYRSDSFTPKSFVSHVGNVTKEDLEKIDLLPRIKDKVLITKELAPLFNGKPEELRDRFAMLITILDGKGFTSDSGMHGRRGYEGDYVFNWLGATTPLKDVVHRMMSQLGTRLLFFEVPAEEPNVDTLAQYAQNDTAAAGGPECREAVNAFLAEFFKCLPLNSVDQEVVAVFKPAATRIAQCAELLVNARAEVIYEDNNPVAVKPPEGPYKIVQYFRMLARGHALICGRIVVNDEDIALVAEVALSSIPGHLRPLVREFQRRETITSSEAVTILRSSTAPSSAPTARKYLHELAVLGIGDLTKGDTVPATPDTLTLAKRFRWLLDQS